MTNKQEKDQPSLRPVSDLETKNSRDRSVSQGTTVQIPPQKKTMLSAEQKKRCKEAFDAFDLDKNNKIDIHELETALINMGHKPTEEELYKMMSEDNEDGDDGISYERFLSIIEKQKYILEEKMKPDLMDTFAALGGDSAENGYLDLAKVKDIIINKFGMTIDLDKLSSKIDTSGDMQISFDEFMEMMSG